MTPIWIAALQSEGGFQIKTITPGIYTATVTKIGYITITADDPMSFVVGLVKNG